MRLIGLCIIFCSVNSYAKSLTVIDWISYFEQQNIHIIYSSDFLKPHELNTLVDSQETILSFSQALKPQDLKLVSINKSTYVINATDEITRPTGLIVAVVDEFKKPIKDFRINNLTSTNGLVLINKSNADAIELKISAANFITKNANIKFIAGKYLPLTFSLIAQPLRIDKIIVTASQVNFLSPKASTTSLLREDIENTVTLGSDPLRATHNIPGNSSSGLTGKTRTRGGKEDESLIVLDNHILRNPYHFQDFYSLFSTINLSTVESLDFYSGVFPLQYGGRLSSVLAIQTEDGNNQYKHEIGADLLNAYYTFRHNSPDFNQQYLASFRTGGHLLNLNIFENNNIKPEFDDIYLKSIQQLSNNWSSSQHLLYSRDEIKIDNKDKQGFGENTSAADHDLDVWLQVHNDNQKNLISNLQLYMTRSHNSRLGDIANDNSIASLNQDVLTQYFGIKFQQTLVFRDNISFKYGLDINYEDTQINKTRQINHYGELAQQLDLSQQSTQNINFSNNGLSANAFFNTRYQLNRKWIFDIGMRFEKKQWIDENIKSPRFNLSYFYNDTTTFRFAFGRHQQAQHIDEFLLEDITPEYFDPTSADIAVLELNKTFSATLSLRAEIYYKKYSSTQPYYENLFNQLHILPELFYDRVRITPDDSEALGAEFTLKGNTSNFQWAASYVFSDVDDIIDDSEVARSWDQHNALKFNLHMPFSVKYLNQWQLDLAANYHSGWAKTEVTEDLQISERNSTTFDDFFQLDLKLSKHIKTQTGQLSFIIQASNLLQNKNPCCVDYEIENSLLVQEKQYWLSITPNLSVIYRWN